ncbi:MAG: sigma-54 interaction domain-containing protein [Bacteroidales bacterium]
MAGFDLQNIKQKYSVIGNCDALNRALEIAMKIAPVDLTVLITGENGAGKEVFPRIIHDNSLRKHKRYLAVNCGAIPEGTIDSELFGHEKGAFTGAVEQREGYFAAANGGTLFLDEVGELPLATQARLLRVLETGEYIRVGSSEVRKTDVRIVAATNVNLEQAIHDGKFREDLYYRLNTIAIHVPPLRERGRDSVMLFKKFALDMSEKYRMPAVRLTPQAEEWLSDYAWPGNVRQLKNLAESLSVTADTREITPEILQTYLPKNSAHSLPAIVGRDETDGGFKNEREILYQILFDLRRDVSELKKIVHGQNAVAHHSVDGGDHAAEHGNVTFLNRNGRKPQITPAKDELPIWEAEEVTEVLNEPAQESPVAATATTASPPSLEQLERDLIRQALRSCHGRRKAAAEQLGISERTLYRKIKEYGLEDEA